MASSSKTQIKQKSGGSKTQVPQKPSSVKSQPSTSKKPATSKSASSTVKEKKEFVLPAFSLTYKPKYTESELDKLNKKTIRRNAPPGEDLKTIKKILRSLIGQNISVQEFISLIAPSTGDRGETLRQVMNEDLASFRKLARKVYDMITQDNSDVLLNQQLQLAEYYKEKKNLLNAKMMSMIEEIYSIVPKFDFDRYAKEKEKYLEELLPIPEELVIEPEEMEMMKRQAAYHRLQWLRSEGERLKDENNSLKKRLNQMKKLHMQEQRKMEDMERMAEAKKNALEEEESVKQETLEMLNRSLEKTIIAQEQSFRQEKDATVLQPVAKGSGAVKKQKSKTKVKRPRRSKWNEEAAANIESQTINERKRSELRKTDPFHFSPIKTPPRKQAAPKQASPFHYSPPKTPEGAHYVSPTLPPTRVVPQSHESGARGRRVQGPRDSWAGFY